MEPTARELALEVRAGLEHGLYATRTASPAPRPFRDALASVRATDRDAWVDLALGLGEPPGDEGLPRGCVPYLPCSVDTLLHAVDGVPITAADVFVDVGSGLGRATALVHLLTGATTIGLEIQAGLARAARELAARLRLPRVTTLHADASTLGSSVPSGSVFFLYCPFSGERLARFFTSLEPLAGARALGLCCVDMPAPARDAWLETAAPTPSLRIYRSTKRA